jgi:aminoglycoside phosphotransferase (APT) family kinase protein
VPHIEQPDLAVLDWAAGMLGTARPEVLRGLRGGGSPWLLRTGDREAVLRVGQPGDQEVLATEAAALRLAGRAGVAAPELLGADDGGATGVPLVLMSRLPGSSTIPREPDPARLAALGAAAAALHAIPLEPSDVLPARDRPIAGEDFARMRRDQPPQPLLVAAERAVAGPPPSRGRPVLVHGDLWHGNTVWADGALAGLVDWDCAGSGQPGVDLGSLRCDAAICFGPETAGHVSRGWEQAAGRPADDVAYWDVIAALATPPDMGWFPAAIAEQGRPDLDQATLRDRRDAFLRQALGRLP